MAKVFNRQTRKKHLIFLFCVSVTIITSFLVASYYSQNTSADGTTGSCTNDGHQPYGRSYCSGYFNNVQDKNAAGGNGYILPVISDGQAIPDSVNTADELYNLIYNAYVSGDRQRVTGAALIYNTMMGNKAPGAGRDGITDSEWAVLKSRLEGLNKAKKIVWDATEAAVSKTITSYWQGEITSGDIDKRHGDDATFYIKDSIPSQKVIKFYDYNGNKVYQLSRLCANPTGTFLPIPPSWALSVTSVLSVRTSQQLADRALVEDTLVPSSTNPIPTANVGDYLRWKHTVTNTGADTTDRQIEYGHTNSGFSANDSGISNDYTKVDDIKASDGLKAVTSNSFNFFLPDSPVYAPYKVQTVDAGETLCSAAKTSDTSSSNPADLPATNSCVTINKPTTSTSWNISTTSLVTAINGVATNDAQRAAGLTAKPGDIITWTHTVTDDNPSVSKVVNYNFQDRPNLGTGWGTDQGYGKTYPLNTGQSSASFTSTYTVNPSGGDAGKSLCRATSASPKSSSDLTHGTESSPPACVTVSPIPPPVSTCMSFNGIQSAVDYNGSLVPYKITNKRTGGTDPSLTPSTYPNLTNINLSQYTTGDEWTISEVGTLNGTVPDYSWKTVSVYDSGNMRANRTITIDTSRRDGGSIPPYGVIRTSQTSSYIDAQTRDAGGIPFFVGEAQWISGPTPSSTILAGGTVVGRAPNSLSPIGPCYDYSLFPSVSTNVGRVIEADSLFNVTPQVRNDSYSGSHHTHSASTQWRLTQMVIPAGSPVPTDSGNSLRDPCNFFGVYSGCSSTNASVFDTNINVMPSSPFNSGDSAAGTHICFALSVYPRWGLDKTFSLEWNHSAPVCLVVGKKPKVQIWGGDLWAGNIVDTSTSKKSGNTFGSWIEYGIFAKGNIAGAASGAAYASGGAVTFCNASKLSFTNTPCTDDIVGNYNNAKSIPDVAASFPVNASDPTRNLGSNIDLSTPSLQGIYTATGAVTITGGGGGKFIKKEQWIVINAPEANITITGDIYYTHSTLHSTSEIPQVVIIAKNITINSDVTNVDAWLIAKNGRIDTCNTKSGLTIYTCGSELTVNGPVMANQLYLYRTAGSGLGSASSLDGQNHSGDPAEVFNLRADAYLWAAARASVVDGRAQTVYTTELPPRF